MDRGALWATVHGVTKESDMTDRPTDNIYTCWRTYKNTKPEKTSKQKTTKPKQTKNLPKSNYLRAVKAEPKHRDFGEDSKCVQSNWHWMISHFLENVPHIGQPQCSRRWVKCNRKPAVFLAGETRAWSPEQLSLLKRWGGVNLGKERTREEEP